MIQIWPAELPRPERSTWQMVPQEARRKSRSDAGPTTYRRRFSAVARMVTLSVLLSRNEKAVFDRFFHETCAEGSSLFYMPDPTTEGWALLSSDGSPILTDAGLPLLLAGRWLCSWGDSLPTEAVVGIEFRKSFSVVVMP
jgi:hypothetical protein